MMEFYSKWPKAIVDLRTPSPVEIGFALVVRHAVPKNLDFLKIDVDSYDCEYLKAILAAGYSPKAVDIELTPSIPPPLKYMLKWNPEYPVFGSILGGCSLSMAMDIIQPYGYTLIQYAMEDGWFVKDEYAHLFGSVHPDPTDLYELGNPDHYAPNIWTGDINGSSMVEELVHLRGNPAAMLARAQEGIRKTIAESTAPPITSSTWNTSSPSKNGDQAKAERASQHPPQALTLAFLAPSGPNYEIRLM